MKPSAIVIIPARWKSTRFPGKPLAVIAGKPMLQRVIEQCRKARRITEVFVATDDARIFAAARQFGARAVITRADHRSGTDRIAEVARKLRANIFVNVQGDEPLISPRAIDSLAESLARDHATLMATLACAIRESSEQTNPNVVKVVVDRARNALYFSRSMIPFARDAGSSDKIRYLKHLGIYAYRRSFLLRWPRLKPTPLEQAEKLEQLRALENGVAIRVLETKWNSVGVDVPGDIPRVEALL